MTMILRQYSSVASNGEPVQPPSVQANGIADDTPTQLAADTIYADVTPSVDSYVYIAAASANATSANGHKVTAGTTKGFPVAKGSRPYVACKASG